MEDKLRPIYQERASDDHTLGVLVVEKMKPNSPITDNFDAILLIIVNEQEPSWYVKHYTFEDNKTAAMHIVTSDLLMNWLDTSGFRKTVAWIIHGKVKFDRNEFVANLKEQLRVFPNTKRNLRKAIEFGKLIRSFTEVKDLYESEQYKDAYSRIIHALHYLARLTVIEKGYHPEVTVWDQVKQIDLEVYKLYDELIESHEEINKRVQLMILAADYVISSRAEQSSKHLLDVMEGSDEPWTYNALISDERVAPYSLNVTAMLTYLIEKNIVHTKLFNTKGVGVYHCTYEVNPDCLQYLV